MRKTLGVFLLVLFLTSSANAGLIPNKITPPQTAVQDQVKTDDGTNDDLTESVLLTLLSLL